MWFEIVFALASFIIVYLSINNLWMNLLWELGLFCIKLLTCVCYFWAMYSIYRGIEDFYEAGGKVYQDSSRMLALLKQKCQNLEYESSTLTRSAQEMATKYHNVLSSLAIMTKEMGVVKNERQVAQRDCTYQITLSNELYEKLKSYERKLSKKDAEMSILRDQCEQQKVHESNMSIDELPSHLKTVIDSKLNAILDEQFKALTDAANEQLRTLEQKHEKELQARDNAHRVALQKLNEEHNNIIRKLESEKLIQIKQTEDAIRHELKTAQVTEKHNTTIIRNLDSEEIIQMKKTESALRRELETAHIAEQQLHETIKVLSSNIGEAQTIVQKVQTLETEVASMKQTEQSLRNQLKTAQDTEQQLYKTTTARSNDIGEVQAMLHKVQALEVELSNKKQTENTLRLELKLADNKASRFREQTQTLRNEREATQATVSRSLESESMLRHNLQEAQATVLNLADRETSLRNELQNAQVTVQKLSESKTFLGTEVAAAQATVQALQVSDKELRSSLAQAQLLADNYKRVADRSQSAANDLKVELAKAVASTADLSSAQAYISQLQNDVAQKDQIIQDGTKTVQDLVDTKARLEAALNEIASAPKQQDNAQDEIVKLKEELEQVREDYSCLVEQKDDIRDTLWEVQDILVQSGAKEDVPFNHVKALDEVVGKLEDQYAKVLKELQAANGAVEASRNAVVATANLEIEASLAILEEERNQLKAENVELKEALKSTRPMAKPVSKLKKSQA